MVEAKIPKEVEKINRGLGFHHGVLIEISRLD